MSTLEALAYFAGSCIGSFALGYGLGWLVYRVRDAAVMAFVSDDDLESRLAIDLAGYFELEKAHG